MSGERRGLLEQSAARRITSYFIQKNFKLASKLAKPLINKLIPGAMEKIKAERLLMI